MDYSFAQSQVQTLYDLNWLVPPNRIAIPLKLPPPFLSNTSLLFPPQHTLKSITLTNVLFKVF